METITERKDRKWFSDISENLSKYFRIFLYLIIFTGASATFSSCVGGYVASEPSYDVTYDRPVSPGVGYIWIDGDWRWNNRTHIYEHEHGYWSRPRNGHSYVSGHWENAPRGKYWVRGRWSRENQTSARARDTKSDHDRDKDRDHDHR